jgi:hypothetical protein
MVASVQGYKLFQVRVSLIGLLLYNFYFPLLDKIFDSVLRSFLSILESS